MASQILKSLLPTTAPLFRPARLACMATCAISPIDQSTSVAKLRKLGESGVIWLVTYFGGGVGKLNRLDTNSLPEMAALNPCAPDGVPRAKCAECGRLPPPEVSLPAIVCTAFDRRTAFFVVVSLGGWGLPGGVPQPLDGLPGGGPVSGRTVCLGADRSVHPLSQLT